MKTPATTYGGGTYQGNYSYWQPHRGLIEWSTHGKECTLNFYHHPQSYRYWHFIIWWEDKPHDMPETDENRTRHAFSGGIPWILI